MSRDKAFVRQSEGVRHTPPCVSRAVDTRACSHNKPRNTKQMKMFISSLMWFVREMALGVAVFLTVFAVNPQTVILEIPLV